MDENKENRAVNDATLTKAGDIYQYLIALIDCFELNDGEKLQIEVNGDVSILNKAGGKFQKEVKHHFGEKNLTDRDIDFWKTLANWYVEFDTQADITAVNKMYKTIFDEINLIGANTGFLPQIIIVDHVDGKDLECKNEFDAYVRCNWRDGKALI